MPPTDPNGSPSLNLQNKKINNHGSRGEKKINWSELVLRLNDEQQPEAVANIINRSGGLSDQERWSLIELLVTGKDSESKLPGSLPTDESKPKPEGASSEAHGSQ